MRENKVGGWKLLVLAIMMLSIILILALSQNSVNVKAESYGCCVHTLNGHTCADWEPSSNCNAADFFQGKACQDVSPECKLGTCILKDGCQYNVGKSTCILKDGVFTLDTNPAACNDGCCGIANRSYGIQTEKWCNDKAADIGYDTSYVEFLGGMTDEKQCDDHFSTQDRGCCVAGTLQCNYESRSECGGGFYKDTYCYQLPDCEVQHHFKRGCGTMPGDKFKVCFFDSAGNQEECPLTCNYPAEMCKTCNNADGCKCENGNCEVLKSAGSSDLVKRGYSVKPSDYGGDVVAYCGSTKCSITDKGGNSLKDQNLTWENGLLHVNKHTLTPTLSNSHSVCYNFYTSADKNVDSFMDNMNKMRDITIMQGRSTGLQNGKLVCEMGEIKYSGFGTERKNLCRNDDQSIVGIKFTNHYENCSKCGEISGFAGGTRDFIGELFGGGSLVVAGFGSIIASLAEQCNADTCHALGDCEFHSKVNLYHGGRTLDHACFPKYPPGSIDMCGYCGKGGDALWNQCEKQECYSYGNCQWKPDNLVWGSIKYLVTAYTLTYVTKFNYIPWYTLIDSALCSTGVMTSACVISGGTFTTCANACSWDPTLICRTGCIWIASIGHEVGRMAGGPIKDSMKSLGGIKGLLSGFLNQIASGFTSQIMNKVVGGS